MRANQIRNAAPGICAAAFFLALQVAAQAETRAADRIDYLAFAQGATPIAIGGDGAALGATYEHAVRIVDGNPTGFVVILKGTDETATEFVYELPAATTFDRFAVPNILETPSPSATFTRLVEVLGSSTSAAAGYELLGSGALAVHKKRGETSELAIVKSRPVRWIKLRLVGGIDIRGAPTALEFSEIIGNGRQEPAPFSERFNGAWKAGANVMTLKQNKSVVSGCYDESGDLSGTVNGSTLRATGVNRSDKTRSAFVISVTPDGELRGVRSSNGGPFRYYAAPVAPPGTETACAAPQVSLGCGSIIHGVGFDFDSAEIRDDAAPTLAALHDGLSNDSSASIVIEGHTSSEGSTEYNQALSERRARATVADLTKRGLKASRLAAVGVGEIRPIAPNDDESGRAINRRVEVVCK